MRRDDKVYKELAMLTGVANRNTSYLFYLLVKDGSYFIDGEKEEEMIPEVPDFDDWFNGMGELQ